MKVSDNNDNSDNSDNNDNSENIEGYCLMVNDICSMCRESFKLNDNLLVFNCGHFIHTLCYYNKLDKCPICRSYIKYSMKYLKINSNQHYKERNENEKEIKEEKFYLLEKLTNLEIINIRDIIENMNKFNQVEILRILYKNKINLNENKYGVHINLSELDNYILFKLQEFINYVNTQEDTLNDVEQQKETFKNIYFSKDNKDI